LARHEGPVGSSVALLIAGTFSAAEDTAAVATLLKAR
jgi:hypothetical protein